MGRRASAAATCRAARSARCPVAAFRRSPPAFQAGYADAWLNILGVLSQATQRANYDRDGTPQAPGTAGRPRDRLRRVRVLRAGRVAAAARTSRVTAGLRYSVYSPPYEVNGLQVAPTISMGEWFDQRAQNALQRHSLERERDRHVRPGRPEERQARASTTGTRTTSRRASRWRGRRRERHRSCAAATRRCSTASASAWRRTSTKASRSACRRTISSPFGLAYETNPAARFVSSTTMPSTHAGGAGRAASRRRRRSAPASSRTSIDDTLVTPSAHMAQRDHRLRPQPQLHDRGRLRRPLRPRLAGSPRSRDAAQPGGSGVGHRLLHGGADA